jgi:hypothetical protein
MKILTPGHSYELENFEPTAEGQVIQFIQKEPVAEGSKEMRTVNNGTTNEEVLAMLIDRLNYLNGKFSCPENLHAIAYLSLALAALNARTRDRMNRLVEGKHRA